MRKQNHDWKISKSALWVFFKRLIFWMKGRNSITPNSWALQFSLMDYRKVRRGTDFRYHASKNFWWWKFSFRDKSQLVQSNIGTDTFLFSDVLAKVDKTVLPGSPNDRCCNYDETGIKVDEEDRAPSGICKSVTNQF